MTPRRKLPRRSWRLEHNQYHGLSYFSPKIVTANPTLSQSAQNSVLARHGSVVPAGLDQFFALTQLNSGAPPELETGFLSPRFSTIIVNKLLKQALTRRFHAGLSSLHRNGFSACDEHNDRVNPGFRGFILKRGFASEDEISNSHHCNCFKHLAAGNELGAGKGFRR